MADGETRPKAPRAAGARPGRGRQLLVVTLVAAAVVIFIFPAFVAFRYTAPSQRLSLIHI